MSEEVLRLDRVTYIQHGVKELNHFSLRIFAGESMGLIPLNGIGLQVLMKLLRQNGPIHYGYVHYRQKPVNQWKNSDNSYNRISIIGSQSGLAGSLTVADNVFVLRSGFGKWMVQPGVLRRQLLPFLREIGVDISADAAAEDLTTFQRYVVEIVRAVVAGNKLIVLMDADSIISEAELHELRGILQYYTTQKAVSFLYISRHYEEVRKTCSRAALMVNGQIIKVVNTRDIDPKRIHCFEVDAFENLVLTKRERQTKGMVMDFALRLNNLITGSIQGLSFDIAPGECVVVQDLDNRIFEDLVDAITLNVKPESGQILVKGKRLGKRCARDVAVIQQLAWQSMLFKELSYIDNLCFTMDHRLRRVWLHRKVQHSIRCEYEQWLGADVFDKSVDELTQLQRYDLIYARILLQRPEVVFCVQPFVQADVEQRMHIWTLLQRLMKKGIALVILAVNLADTLSLADRLIRVQGGCVLMEYERSEFGSLPEDVPWHHLWEKKE